MELQNLKFDKSSIVANDMCYIENNDGFVYGLNAANGKIIWNYTTGTALGDYLANNHLWLSNNHLYAGSSLGAYCFDAANGTLIWNFTAPDYLGRVLLPLTQSTITG